MNPLPTGGHSHQAAAVILRTQKMSLMSRCPICWIYDINIVVRSDSPWHKTFHQGIDRGDGREDWSNQIATPGNWDDHALFGFRWKPYSVWRCDGTASALECSNLMELHRTRPGVHQKGQVQGKSVCSRTAAPTSMIYQTCGTQLRGTPFHSTPCLTAFIPRQAKGPAAWNSFQQQNKGLSRVEMLLYGGLSCQTPLMQVTQMPQNAPRNGCGRNYCWARTKQQCAPL